MARVLSSRPGLRQLRRLAPVQLPESPSGLPQARQCSSDQAGFVMFVIYCLSSGFCCYSALVCLVSWTLGPCATGFENRSRLGASPVKMKIEAAKERIL